MAVEWPAEDVPDHRRCGRWLVAASAAGFSRATPSLSQPLTRRACAGPRNTSHPAMCISWCSPRDSRVATRSPRSRCTGRCACSIRSPYMFFCSARRHHSGGLLAGGAGEAAQRPRAAAADRRIEAARRRRRPRWRSLEAELLADPKENSEHVMLVDLARNDLGQDVATAGSVRVGAVPRDRALQPYHAYRERRQRHIGAGTGRVRFVRRQLSRRHPGGPHRRCARWRSSTNWSRWVGSSTAVRSAILGGSGDMDQAITIRTLVFRGDTYSYQAGGGIVAENSLPTSEIRARMAKSAVLRRALTIAAEGL